MRLIDLKCRHCGSVFEELVRSSEDPSAIPCPECGQQGAEKQISAAAFLGGGRSVSPGSSSTSCGGGGRFS